MSPNSVSYFTSTDFKSFVKTVHDKQRQDLLEFKTDAERAVIGRDERRLARIKSFESDWKAFQVKACERTNRDASKTIFSRVNEFRERWEANQVLEAASPVTGRFGENLFYCSLRGGDTGFVEAGGSGLFVRVKPKDRKASMLRRSEDLATQFHTRSGPPNWKRDPTLLERLSLGEPTILPGVLPIGDYFVVKGVSLGAIPGESG